LPAEGKICHKEEEHNDNIETPMNQDILPDLPQSNSVVFRNMEEDTNQCNCGNCE
jgi:hypothetical protein